MKVTQTQLNNMEMLRVREWDTWCFCQQFARIARHFYGVHKFNV